MRHRTLSTCTHDHDHHPAGTVNQLLGLSGFALVAPPAEYVEMVDALHLYFSFHPLAASA